MMMAFLLSEPMASLTSATPEHPLVLKTERKVLRNVLKHDVIMLIAAQQAEKNPDDAELSCKAACHGRLGHVC